MTKTAPQTPADRLAAAHVQFAAASAEQRRSALLFADAHQIDPTSGPTEAARAATEEARAALLAAEAEVRAAGEALAHEKAMLALAATERADTARAEKRAHLDELVATLSGDRLHADVQPILAPLTSLYDQAAALVERLDAVVLARAARRREAQRLLNELGIRPQAGDPLHFVVSDADDRPVSLIRTHAAAVLGRHATAHNLPRTAAQLLAVAAPEAA